MERSPVLKDVVEVQALAPYRFRVRFEDGVEDSDMLYAHLTHSPVRVKTTA